MSEKIKVTVSLPPDTVDDIKRLADRLGVSASELLRRAVRTEGLLDQIEAERGQILVKRAGGEMVEIVRR